MPSLLEIKNLSVNFNAETGTVSAVKNISLTVNRGEIMAIVGESGSGKSVTALSILQLLPLPPATSSTGEILFSDDGENTTDLLNCPQRLMQHIRGHKIGIIFQEPMTSLNPVLTCGYQVMETIQAHKNISRAEARQQTLNWFAKVMLPDPASLFRRYPHQLSGGQKQRVMIAMAICCGPSLLICDEPTTALDVTVQKTILELIKKIQEESNIGVIFITHDLTVVAEIADVAAVMHKGEVVEKGSIKEIFFRPQHSYTRALLACMPVNHKRGERLPVVSDFLMSASGSHRDNRPHPVAIVSTADPVKVESITTDSAPSPVVLLRVQDLSVWFPVKKNILGKPVEIIKAVDGINMEVYKGETLGLVGESGCGKTTLGRTLLRLVKPAAGKIFYEDIEITAQKNEALKSVRKEMQIVFQDPYSSLNPRITIGAAIAEPMKVHAIFTSSKQRKEKVIELLEKVNLDAGYFNRYPHEFSGGQRQRIVIARALSVNPSFIVCDESVSALDVSVQAQVLNLLNDLKKEFGFTIIFISHDLSVVRYISDRIIVMNKGRIEESGKADAVYFNPQTAYTKKLVAAVPKGLAGFS